MKNVLKILALILSFSLNLTGQNTKEFSYPTTEQIKNALSFEDKIELLQIPDNFLKNSTNDEIIRLTLEYPLNGHYLFYYDNPMLGLEIYLEHANIYHELVRRKSSIINTLVDELKKYSINEILKSPGSMINYNKELNSALCILSYPEFQAQLSDIKKRELIKDLLDKIVLVDQNLDLFGNFSADFYYYTAASTFTSTTKTQNPLIIEYIEHKTLLNESIKEEIITKCNNYIK
jgi:hypothetical protein